MESIIRSRPRELSPALAQPQVPAQPEPVDAASAVFSPPLPGSELPRGPRLPDAVARRGVPAAGWPPRPPRALPDRDRAPGS